MDLEQLQADIRAFREAGQLGPDPVAARYEERRAAWSLFTPNLTETEMEVLGEYVFCYDRLPETPGDAAVPVRNLIAGEWRTASRSAVLHARFDRRVPLMEIPASGDGEVDGAVSAADAYWRSLEWADEVVSYRKWVVKNFSRLLQHFYDRCIREIRHQIPKTKLEADKDFWEARRAADHIEGSAELAMRAGVTPPMIEGHMYWKNDFIPAGVAAIITPMNFIYGIPAIQIVGCYMSGSPFIFKGHPFAGISNTTLIRMLIAAGANPKAVQKLEGFGRGIQSLTSDPRVRVVSVTGSDETAETIQKGRGLGTLWFEGGGVNWAWVDEGFTDDELRRIAERLTYSKLGFSSHKCSTLHGIAAPPETLRRLTRLVDEEMDRWTVKDPRTAGPGEAKVIGPLMVHKASTVTAIQEAAREAGVPVVREGGKVTEGEYAEHAEVARPVILGPIRPGTTITAEWDGTERTFDLATTELFQPILVTMEMADFDEFLRFSLCDNPHDLIVSIYSKDDALIQRARKVLGGMLKENDGTDSALEWEAFGASGIGRSGNTGVGEAVSTIAMFCRKQKGRHVVISPFNPVRG